MPALKRSDATNFRKMHLALAIQNARDDLPPHRPLSLTAKRNLPTSFWGPEGREGYLKKLKLLIRRLLLRPQSVAEMADDKRAELLAQRREYARRLRLKAGELVHEFDLHEIREVRCLQSTLMKLKRMGSVREIREVHAYAFPWVTVRHHFIHVEEPETQRQQQSAQQR